MKKFFSPILFFAIILITNSLYGIQKESNSANSNQNVSYTTIADSIYNAISKVSDTLIMDKLYLDIKKNRRKLSSNYLPLLHFFVKKAEVNDYPIGKMRALDRIGLQHRYSQQYDSAVYYHNQSLVIALELKDSIQLYYNYNNLGQVYRMQDLNVQAIYYFHKALKISNATGNFKSSSFTMNSLGASYVVQKDFEQAMYYFRASTKLATELNDKRTLAYNYGSMGEVFLLKNQNDSAMHYFVKSKNLIIELGSKRGYAVAEHLVGQAYFAMNEFEQAEKYFNIALPLHLKDNNLRYQALCYAYLGKIKARQHKLDSAEWYLNKGKDIALSIHSHENLILVYDALFELYKNNTKWKEAVISLQQSQIYQDSIISIANAKEIQSLEIAYKTYEKEQQIKLLSAENEIKNQRFKMSLILIGLLILAIFMGIYVQIMRKKQTQFTQDKLRQQLLLSQMNPHFIFNALASIQSFMYKNEAKKAAAYMGNFAALSRSILNNSSANSILLEEEIETLRNYIELEKMRMQSGFEYEIIIPDEIDAEFIQIPPMLLQPFVENAIKHGLAISENKGKLTIVFSEFNKLISAEITDNGAGINKTLKDKNPAHKSKATEIFKQRMKILQKQYRNIPEPQFIDLFNQETKQTGTKVLILIPIVNA